MENKLKSSAPTKSGSTPPEVSISRQQAALAGSEDADLLLSQNNLPRRAFRFTETETRTRQVEMVFLRDPLSDSPEESLSELAEQVRPELIEAGIIRRPEQTTRADQPPKVVSRATGAFVGLTRLSAALFEFLKGLKRLLGIWWR